jgi:serine phosphatase RsbU (regulator of sigma subunit)
VSGTGVSWHVHNVLVEASANMPRKNVPGPSVLTSINFSAVVEPGRTLYTNGSGLRVGLAGHPAVLQVCAKTNEIKQWECPNMPLGILACGEFVSSEIRAERGDILALYTDGLLETANAAGEEFGIKRLEAELRKCGTEPLDAICRSVQESVARHGAQFDDQSLLLIRQLLQ